MKTRTPFFILTLILTGFQPCRAQQSPDWTESQLMAPAALASAIQSGKNIPIIYCVGPGAAIAHSIDIGMTGDSVNLRKFKEVLSKVPRDADIVIYCGCCPFAHCPNVRPAMAVLQEMKFTDYHLLNLPHNIKADWIEKGYPRRAQ
jgi:hypothetical protein